MIGLRDRKKLRENLLKPAIEKGFIELEIPGQIRNPKQRYRLTGLGLGYHGFMKGAK